MVNSTYIHIPFCQKICHYCDFVKFFYDEKLADDYLEALQQEMTHTLKDEKKTMRTIYIGGGTPTALTPKQLEKLMKIIHKHFHVDQCLEFTIEANPGAFSREKMRVLKHYGVNRISLGVQVFDNEMLKELGRLHQVDDVYQTINDLKREAFHNVSLDLIYALPHQTVEQFQNTLDEAFTFGLPHYSTYSLQIEPKTVFYNMHRKGQLHRPTHEAEAEMFEVLRSNMKKHGYHHYEISNFAKKGYESQHNLTYWSNDYYYGFGAGAHGYLPGKRLINFRPVPAYIKEANETGKAVLKVEEITKKEEIEEELFLGLRKEAGVSKEKFKQKFNHHIKEVYGKELQYLHTKGWIYEDENIIKMTENGLLFGNEVFAEFLLDEDVIL